MIQRFQLIRHVGRFESYSAGADTDLGTLSLIYAENARGKTTLSAILRSLTGGDPIPIVERRQLGASGDPHVVIGLHGKPSQAVYQNSTWSMQYPDILIFDDTFVHENVHSGLDVDASHRQHLHDIIIGRVGVRLAREVDALTQEIATLQDEVREKTERITPDIRGTLTVDEFCALERIADIDTTIKQLERQLKALREAGSVKAADEFSSLSLPVLDTDALEEILLCGLPDLDTAAAKAVQAHFSSLGEQGEAWIADGMEFLSASAETKENDCPFCGQDLRESTLVDHYRAYFGEQYQGHKNSITERRSEVSTRLGGDTLVSFQRQFGNTLNLLEFWGRFLEVPEVTIDLDEIRRIWQESRDMTLQLIDRKAAAPLEVIELDDDNHSTYTNYVEISQQVTRARDAMVSLNPQIRKLKEDIESGDAREVESQLQRLNANKRRFDDNVDKLCTDYLASKSKKESLETRKAQARQLLDDHRRRVISHYQEAINDYLEQFNADFKIVEVTATNPRGIPSSTYMIEINSRHVAVAGTDYTHGEHGFRNTLSSGDRNTLALAFFFAWLGQEQNLNSVTVAIDDPISSLDDSRAITTAQEIRNLAGRVQQLILLSHSKQLLCTVWQHADRSACTALEIVRTSSGSEIVPWNIHEASITEHDKYHELLRGYDQGSIRDKDRVAQSLRPFIDGFLRIVYPEQFPPGSSVGNLVSEANQRLGTPDEILSETYLRELQNLNEYARRFHHDSNPAYDDTTLANINEGELQGFVQRTLAFATRHD
ncbi:AAA family ATPase [Candidatus Neomarinimicrobiota bacterium]